MTSETECHPKDKIVVNRSMNWSEKRLHKFVKTNATNNMHMRHFINRQSTENSFSDLS